MLAQMLNSEVNGTSAYKIEYEELEVPVRRGASGMGIVVNAWSAHDAASRLSQAHLQAAPMPFRPCQASLDTLARL